MILSLYPDRSWAGPADRSSSPFADAWIPVVGGFRRALFQCALNVAEANAACVADLSYPPMFTTLESHAAVHRTSRGSGGAIS